MSYREGRKTGGGGRGRGSNTRFTGKRGGSSYRGRGGASGGQARDGPAPKREDDGTQAQEKFEEIKIADEVDERLGFWRFESAVAAGETKIGWLVNMHQVCGVNELKADW